MKVEAARRFLAARSDAGEFRGAVVVARRGEVLLRQAYGLANEEWQVGNTPTTKFRIGSVTKQITAVAVLRLVAAGALDLHGEIARWLDGMPPAWATLTAHQLLTHTAGLADLADESVLYRLAATGATPRMMIELIADAPLAFSPGTSWRYSNTGFVLLGMLIENASGRAYAAYLDDELFRPLGMTATGCDTPPAILRERASGYTVRDGRLENARYMDMRVPFAAGGLYSTVDDLLRWTTALHGGEILDAELYRRMIHPHTETWTPGELHGYGTFVSGRAGITALSHAGATSGFAASLRHYLALQATVIVLSNACDVAIESIESIAETLSEVVLSRGP